ncbi:diguanylate phosphodiesterase [Pantoea sp. Acro-805]|uniref:Diguanylate phosphodiesterase n=1 Tax=Candidatus Pantoea formicae TaxID=2608355 RepID=A0ABX0QQ80_9GAMM|nr:diguanylate phosphodiesterase [Pantoea formicae]MDF7649036.1 diguanylate phosphodiesterase [Erwiniaceae bacterium L1_54_3]NIE98560.1 diguanylate phosphodiesterase [Pantoea formicae]
MQRSESLISNAASGLFADPIVGRVGAVLAVKIRTESASPGKLFGQWGSSSKWEKRKLLKEQLQLINKKSHYFLTNNILCCIHIDFDMADLLIQDTEISALAKSKSFLRLEISEDFPNLSDGRSNRLLQTLSNDYLLWLGDLGSGGASLRALQEKLYDAVRINRDFFNLYSQSVIWPVIIKNVMRYCNFIFITDVSYPDQYVTLEKDISVMSRRFIKSVPLEEIEQLNKNFEV